MGGKEKQSDLGRVASKFGLQQKRLLVTPPPSAPPRNHLLHRALHLHAGSPQWSPAKSTAKLVRPHQGGGEGWGGDVEQEVMCPGAAISRWFDSTRGMLPDAQHAGWFSQTVKGRVARHRGLNKSDICS